VDAAAGAAREARYAEAIDVVACQQVPSCGQIHRGVSSAMARAVMAVADEEQAELRAEVERMRVRDADLEAALKQANLWSWELNDRAESAESRLDALVADLRGLADVADHADTCDVELSPGAGYPCSCWQADLRSRLDKHAGEQAQGGEGA
jgi:hypothetical protein